MIIKYLKTDFENMSKVKKIINNESPISIKNYQNEDNWSNSILNKLNDYQL